MYRTLYCLMCVPPFHHQVELDYLPLYDCRGGLGLTVWSPLASGILTGRYSGGTAPEGSRLALEAHKVSTAAPPHPADPPPLPLWPAGR